MFQLTFDILGRVLLNLGWLLVILQLHYMGSIALNR